MVLFLVLIRLAQSPLFVLAALALVVVASGATGVSGVTAIGATANATANMAAHALTTVTNTNQAAGSERRHRNVSTASGTTTTSATTAVFATAFAIAAGLATAAATSRVASVRRLETLRIDQLDQRFARITELAHAMLDAIRPEVLGNQLLDPLLGHRLRDHIGVYGHLLQGPSGRDLCPTESALIVQRQIENAQRIRVVSGGVGVVVLQTHVLVEDTVVGEVFLQQLRKGI